MDRNSLVICPVHNEENTIEEFYKSLRKDYQGDIFFVDDGSTDQSKDFLSKLKNNNTFVIHHPQRSGYASALATGFKFALDNKYRKAVTIDADLQHKPAHIYPFLKELEKYEVILGFRYIKITDYLAAPKSRLAINRYIAKLIKQLCSVEFADPFCGLRGYRNSFLKKLRLREKSYGGSLEILLEIIRTKASFKELPVEAIYFEGERKFLGGLDDPQKRLLYYLEVLGRKLKDVPVSKGS
jgi:dolichol-phosphate mannosyltransferase